MQIESKLLSIVVIFTLIISLFVAIAGAEEAGVQTPGKNSDFHPEKRSNGNNSSPPDFANNTEFKDRFLKELESNGIDTTEIRVAMDSGDGEKVRTLMDAVRDKLPQPLHSESPDKNEKFDKNDTLQGKQNDMPKNLSKKQGTPEPLPTETESPISPLTIFAGIGAAGCAVLVLKK